MIPNLDTIPYASDVRTCEGAAPGWPVIRVTYGLRYLQGNVLPTFTCTVDAFESLRKARRWPDHPDLSGPSHGLAVRACPDVADVARLHLADMDGVPMHAAANAWYWYSDFDGRGMAGHLYPGSSYYDLTPIERAADLLRIDPDRIPLRLDRDEFTAFVLDLLPEWRLEARACIERHGLDPFAR